MLYASEIIWNGGKEVEKQQLPAGHQRMGRASLGAFRSAPRGIVAAESGFAPAWALLNHRRGGFAKKLYARPGESRRSEEILRRDGSALTARLRAAAAIGRDGMVERLEWGAVHRRPGQRMAEPSIANLVPQDRWRWIKLHNINLD